MPKNCLLACVLAGASLCATPLTLIHAADDDAAARKAPTAEKATEKAEANVVKGKVVDARGEPVAGATVTVDHTLFYNSNIQVKSGKDGTYRVQVPQGSYRVTASLLREYHGKKYKFDLHPETVADFAGSDGAVRNFVWRLSGEKPEGSHGHYGGFVVGYTQPGDFSVQMTDIELTLTPDGPLIDGSKGQPVTRKLVSTGDGFAVQDVPVGRYKITARNAPEDGRPEALHVRLRNTGKFAESLTAEFATPSGPGLAINRIEIEVKKP